MCHYLKCYKRLQSNVARSKATHFTTSLWKIIKYGAEVKMHVLSTTPAHKISLVYFLLIFVFLFLLENHHVRFSYMMLVLMTVPLTP